MTLMDPGRRSEPIPFSTIDLIIDRGMPKSLRRCLRRLCPLPRRPCRRRRRRARREGLHHDTQRLRTRTQRAPASTSFALHVSAPGLSTRPRAFPKLHSTTALKRPNKLYRAHKRAHMHLYQARSIISRVHIWACGQTCRECLHLPHGNHLQALRNHHPRFPNARRRLPGGDEGGCI